MNCCVVFCCPPWPSSIVNKLAFLPPSPSYIFIEENAAKSMKIELLNPQMNALLNPFIARVTPFYVHSKRKRQVACVLINKPNSCKKNGVRPTMLVSHGNAVDIGEIIVYMLSLSSKLNINIVIYDYAGYGASNGSPSEASVRRDIGTLFAHLLDKFCIPQETMILYGQSIGSVPTVWLASKHVVGAVVLHAALLSGLRLICDNPLKRYCYDVLNNERLVHMIKSPVLVIHGTDDNIVDCQHGHEIFEKLSNPLEPLFIMGANHNDCEVFPEYYLRLQRLINQEMKINKKSSSSSKIAIDPKNSANLFHRQPSFSKISRHKTLSADTVLFKPYDFPHDYDHCPDFYANKPPLESRKPTDANDPLAILFDLINRKTSCQECSVMRQMDISTTTTTCSLDTLSMRPPDSRWTIGSYVDESYTDRSGEVTHKPKSRALEALDSKVTKKSNKKSASKKIVDKQTSSPSQRKHNTTTHSSKHIGPISSPPKSPVANSGKGLISKKCNPVKHTFHKTQQSGCEATTNKVTSPDSPKFVISPRQKTYCFS